VSIYDRLWYTAYKKYPDGVDEPPDYVEITSDNVSEVCDYYRLGCGDVAIDTETFGNAEHRNAGRRYAGDALHQVYAEISCIGFYDGVKLFAARRSNLYSIAKVLAVLRDVGWTAVYWNAGFDRSVLRNSGLPEILEIPYVDAAVRKWMICHQLEDKSFGEMRLAWFIETLLRGEKGSFREEVGMDATLGVATLSDEDWGKLLVRVSGDAYYTLLAHQLISDVLPIDLKNEYLEVEVPVSDVIFDMETRGVCVDVEACLEIDAALKEEARKLERAFNERALRYVAEPINLASYPQLSAYFYDTLKYISPPREQVPDIKSETDRSTGESILKFWLTKYSSQEAALLLDYRKVTKLRSSYIAAPMNDMDNYDRIYPKTNQTGTSTGRFNMERPSLHNLPAKEDDRWLETFGKHLNKNDKELPDDMLDMLMEPSARYGLRRIYIPSPGRMFIGADYSQVELRLLAHFSEDETLLDVFRTGKDPHSATGAKLMGVSYDDFVELYARGDMRAVAARRAGKTINFAVLYGSGAYRLAAQLNVSVEEAQKFMDDYFGAHPGVDALKKGVEYYLERKGEVRTILRRVRPIAVFQKGFSFDLDEDLTKYKNAVQGFGVMQKGRREGFNCVIQGSAADIIKLAMIRLYRDKLFSKYARIVLTIHDEIVASCDEHVSDQVAARMVDIMRNPFGDSSVMLVPLDVDCHIGRNLAAIK